MKIVLEAPDSDKVQYTDIEWMPQVGELIEVAATTYRVESVVWKAFKQKWYPHLQLSICE